MAQRIGMVPAVSTQVTLYDLLPVTTRASWRPSQSEGVNMSAYMIAFVTPHSLEWLDEYAKNVPRIIHSHGGRYLAISHNVPNAVEVVEGDGPAPTFIVLFTFPSVNAIKGFLDAPEYAPYKQARVAGTDSVFYAFENDDNAPQLVGQPS
jgi:uncharacterized protein (DUF1330 family)